MSNAFSIVAARKSDGLFRFAGKFNVRGGRIGGRKADTSDIVKHFAHIAALAMHADKAVTDVVYAPCGIEYRFSRC